MRIKLHRSAIFPALLFPVTLFNRKHSIGKNLGGKHAEYLYDAIPTPDYGFILAESSVSGKNGNKNEKIILVKSTNLPTGIYVVEIKTDTETGDVKIIKK